MTEATASPGTGLEVRWAHCPPDHGPAGWVIGTYEQLSGPGVVVVACKACAGPLDRTTLCRRAEDAIQRASGLSLSDSRLVVAEYRGHVRRLAADLEAQLPAGGPLRRTVAQQIRTARDLDVDPGDSQTLVREMVRSLPRMVLNVADALAALEARR